ncbi:hypothetical protein BK411_11765 [Vibrio splendidus]|nr:hypothetical protein BK411_11765 [Vibrio splendidus]
MNSSEEKQVFLLGRILKRDPKRVQNLLSQQKLMAPKVAIEFSNTLLQRQLGNYDNQSIHQVYWDNFRSGDNASDYERVMQIFSHA